MGWFLFIYVWLRLRDIVNIMYYHHYNTLTVILISDLIGCKQTGIVSQSVPKYTWLGTLNDSPCCLGCLCTCKVWFTFLVRNNWVHTSSCDESWIQFAKGK